MYKKLKVRTKVFIPVAVLILLSFLCTAIAVYVSIPGTDAAKGQQLLTIAVTAAIAFVITIVVLWIVTGVALKPLSRLIKNVDIVAHTDPDHDIGRYPDNEFGALATSFKRISKSNKKIATELKNFAENISEGNLQMNVDLDAYIGTYREAMENLLKISDTVRQLVSRVKESSENVTSSARQISDGAQSLAQGATEQAASIEEISASVSHLTEQTSQNAQSSNRARELSHQISEQAKIGNDNMDRLSGALDEINGASVDISNIIKTIEDIAFQTNILALNASVEAARAGVHGKGFAVVANEVKNLAAKSAAAAKETDVMIRTSIKKAENGTKIGKDMQLSLRNILDSVEKSVGEIETIADATNVQAEDLTQVNAALEQISQIVQNNTAMAEESASSSQEMSAQAELLSTLVKSYNL